MASNPPTEATPSMSFKGCFNVYRCPDGHLTVTKDVDDGVTPMFLACRHDGTTDCGQRAVSAGYPEGPMPAELLERFETYGFEWYAPTVKWARRKGTEMLAHVQKGGLVLRPAPRPRAS